MDVSESTSTTYSHPGSPQTAASATVPVSRPTGLTLVLPALKGGKPVVKGGVKSKQRSGSHPVGLQDDEKKISRPVKLKPLKEVLTKLIAQIKKKDDYAFFLKPVDSSQIPGYADVVKHPMDFGTMTSKVHRGKYRSLEEFTSDLRLVTSNAKIFNPPGTIYHTEADRIEGWGLDHISRAASTVIQYETDWNIEIEKDDDGRAINIDDDDDDGNAATPMDLGDVGTGARSPSVVSQAPPGTSRRGARGPYKKTLNTSTLSESIDAEGRLPGSSHGLGAFPAGSDWARTMLALKLKGKRYRTKKERLRIEKEGPPLLADGSLDYTEMEDPFSVLSFFVPELPSRPYVTPLYPTPSPTTQSQPPYDRSLSPPSQPSRPSVPFPTPINIPLGYSSPTLPVPVASDSSGNKRRHWVITRNVNRSKVKEKDEDSEAPDIPGWQTPREVHAADFGSFALLAAELSKEMHYRNTSDNTGMECDDEGKVFDAIRESVECETVVGKRELLESEGVNSTGIGIDAYWSSQRAAVAEEYIRDLVYGGVDGLAYVRSLAEFVTDENRTSRLGLDTSLATWVEQGIVDPLTDGRHGLLRATAQELAIQSSSHTSARSRYYGYQNDEDGYKVSTQVSKSLNIYPSAAVALSALLQIRTHKIDMGCLIKTPGELLSSQEDWAGKIFRERKRSRGQEMSKVERKASVAFEVEEPERTWMDIDASTEPLNGDDRDAKYEPEGPEELNEVLDYVAGIIISLDQRNKERRSSAPLELHPRSTSMKNVQDNPMLPNLSSPGYKVETKDEEGANSSVLLASTAEAEDPMLRSLRLNLLALAKRAPLDTIARLPKDLVPDHLRHFVPTLGAPA